MSQITNSLAAESWAIADLLRGDFRQSQYGRIILPFCLLRRLECVLAPTKDAVLAKFEQIQAMNLPEEAQEKMLLRSTNELSFFNTSKMDLSKLGVKGIKANLENYIRSFSKDVRDIFDHFKFMEFVGLLDDSNLLHEVVQKIRSIDLSPKTISNLDMGLVFEELVRRFAEGSNETAGEHFTPRDIVRLTTSLVFVEDDEALTKPGIDRSIYDPTAGTGGFLSAGMEYVYELNPQAMMHAFGQELNPESYAICKAVMLIKGQEVTNIKLGNTLSNDHLYAHKFDYMLSNPPFGADWKRIETGIIKERDEKGFDGRFGHGLPRVSDSSLLFLMHLISKLRDPDQNGGRIGIILNGSPLFTGGAGSGESEIRRFILESDLLEAVVALPTDMFYNTGIATYIWVLSNKKSSERKGKVQLINGTDLCSKMRKSLGSKRNVMDDCDIETIKHCFTAFEAVSAYPLDKEANIKSNRGRQATTPKVEMPKTITSKIFATYEFGYRRITIERPLRLSVKFTDEAIGSLRFAIGALKPVMEWIYQHLGAEWTEISYGKFAGREDVVRREIKKNFTDLKEKQIKDVLDACIWLNQKDLMEKAQKLRAIIGDTQYDDFNEFDKTLAQAQKATGIKLDAKERKKLLDAITWKNPAAEPIVKNVLQTKEDPIYGKFIYRGEVVEFETDSDLRDNENIPINPSTTVNEINEAYFKMEILPIMRDAWINPDKRDDKDKEIGIVGYEINLKNKLRENGSSIYRQTKLRSIIKPDRAGAYVIDRITAKMVPVRNSEEQLTAFNIDENILKVEYFNLFISSVQGKTWLRDEFPHVNYPSYNLERLRSAQIDTPSIEKQNSIIEFFKLAESLVDDIRLLRDDVFNNPQKSLRKITSYTGASERYEESFATKLPVPLAILWNQATATFADKEKCEFYCRFYEFLGVFLVASILGSLSIEQQKKLLKFNPPKFNSITMAFGYQRLNELRKDYSSSIPPALRWVMNESISSVLEEVTKIRNDIAHRGLTTKSIISETIKKLEDINERFKDITYENFSNYTLVRPLRATYDGTSYDNELEILSGLAINPSNIAKAITKHPLISEKLYWGSLNDRDPGNFFPVLGLVLFEEVTEETGFMAFYFYNSIDKETNGESSQLMYVCPYPCTTERKFKPSNALFP